MKVYNEITEKIFNDKDYDYFVLPIRKVEKPLIIKLPKKLSDEELKIAMRRILEVLEMHRKWASADEAI